MRSHGNGHHAPIEETLCFLAPNKPSRFSATFVYQPGGVAGGNVFTDFNALYEVYNVTCPASTTGTRPPTVIQVDTSFIVGPAQIGVKTGGGAYNLNSVAWEGVATSSLNGGSEVLLLDGVTINGGSATANLIMHLSSNIAFTTDSSTDVITCSGANQVVVINMFENSNMQSDAAGRMLRITNGLCLVLMGDDSTLGDGIHTVMEKDGGAALVQAFGNSYVGTNAVLGAGTVIYWDTASPGVQGAGVTVTNIICPETSVVLANGANQNVKISAPTSASNKEAFVRIDGPSAAYSIGGIACQGGNRAGMRVTLWSAVAPLLSVTYADAGSLAANQIYNPSGAAVLIGGTFASVTLEYTIAIPGWVVVEQSPDYSIEGNHVQGNTANAVAANPVLSPTISFTCLGAAKVVHVEVSAYPINGSGANIVVGTMTLLLDGAAVAGAPTPLGGFANSAALGQPWGGPLTMTWDVTFPDNAAHTLGIQVASTQNLSLGPGTIHAQEKLA